MVTSEERALLASDALMYFGTLSNILEDQRWRRSLLSDTISCMGMEAEAWRSHLDSRGDSALSGAWTNTPWEFYEYDQEMPSTLPIRTAMCVALRSLDLYNPQVILTLNLLRGGYEIPGGHLDLLADGQKESSAQAAARETLEETGLRVDPQQLIPFGYIEAKSNSTADYPPISYMQFFGTYNTGIPGVITDPQVDGADTLTRNELHGKTERGEMKLPELRLVYFGIRAVFRHYELSDEHLTMP